MKISMVYGSSPRSAFLYMFPQTHLLGGVLRLGILRGFPDGARLYGISLIGKRFRGNWARGCLSSMGHEDLAWGLI